MLVLTAFGTLFLMIILLMLCTRRKDRKLPKVASVRYTQRSSSDIERDGGEQPSEASNHDHEQAKVFTHNSSDKRRPHSSSQTSRELPQLPVSGHDTHSVRTSNTQHSGSLSDLSAGGGSPGVNHHSPKGRRLPTPPPGGIADSSEQQHSVQVTDGPDADEDMYARVDDSNNRRLKIRTLDITEGSGDSSFYAKVGDVEPEDVDGVYAQVDDSTTQSVKMSTERPDQPEAGIPAAAEPASPPGNSPGNDKYGAAEYASIDKLKKTSSIRKATGADISKWHFKENTPKIAASEEPVAPPIPERNFDDEDDGELENVEADGQGQEEGEPPAEAPGEEASPEAVQAPGPTYDKLCVRESLDHLRHRQEVEEERRHGYVNLPPVSAGAGTSNSTDVYAQIDENGPEAVYESLSATGSADGSYAPRQPAINDASSEYSSIQEIEEQHTAVQEPRPAPRYPGTNTRPARQHHYEQIERIS